MPLHVSVLYSPAARQVREVMLVLDVGSTVAMAVQASGLLAECPEIVQDRLEFGVWGRRCAPDQLLRDTDRVEIYRKLKVDPKVARRERFVKQGTRSAGLFARRRPGAKAGY